MAPLRRDMNLKNSYLHPLLNGTLVLLLVWLGGLLLFASDAGSAGGIDPSIRVDGIVVLTGGSERVPAGLDLLQAGFAPRLLISGVNRDIDPASLIGDHPAKAKLACCITLGFEAEDTRGNAREAATWVKKQGVKDLILVTASYHIRRSMVEFHLKMPEVRLIPYAVRPASAHLENWWAYPATASLLMEEYNKLLASYLKAALKKVLGE